MSVSEAIGELDKAIAKIPGAITTAFENNKMRIIEDPEQVERDARLASKIDHLIDISRGTARTSSATARSLENIEFGATLTTEPL